MQVAGCTVWDDRKGQAAAVDWVTGTMEMREYRQVTKQIVHVAKYLVNRQRELLVFVVEKSEGDGIGAPRYQSSQSLGGSKQWTCGQLWGRAWGEFGRSWVSGPRLPGRQNADDARARASEPLRSMLTGTTRQVRPRQDNWKTPTRYFASTGHPCYIPLQHWPLGSRPCF